jgi:hypothetical protein
MRPASYATLTATPASLREALRAGAFRFYIAVTIEILLLRSA